MFTLGNQILENPVGDSSTLSVYPNLVQAYEAEFSPITQKDPGIQRRCALDTIVGLKITAYLLQA